MRALLRGILAFAAAALAVRAPPAHADGVCVAYSGSEHASAARAAARALGEPAARLDVGDSRDRDALASRCGRLVVAIGAEAVRAAEALAPGSPLVCAPAPPGGAGGRHAVSADADPRRVLETLSAMAPRARRVGAVYDPARTGDLIAVAQAAARDLGVELVALPVRTVGEAVRAFHRFERELRADALWLLPDGTATVQETVYYALELARWRRMAVIGPSRWYVASGALFAIQPTPEGSGTAAGELGAQVLRGGAPSGAVYARDLALFVNARTAERLGLRVPAPLLDRAAQVLP